ncbi:hypothetical protein TorRG33x02_329290 [Trema orientale]|uniref:Uncharacterized protein n=1 Tax=Trema orientale TaxID=63057 RepID=A0A2P5B8T4_TREOI|nr:hypothetical protein TorRG33x02_329290 [Trema orientale]
MIYVRACSCKRPSMRHKGMSQNLRKSLITRGHAARPERTSYRSRPHRRAQGEALKSEVVRKAQERAQERALRHDIMPQGLRGSHAT